MLNESIERDHYRKPHVFDPIHNGATECECGLVEDAEIHETDEQYEQHMKPRIVNAPARIWLQTGCDNEVGPIDWKELVHEEVSWCAERIDATDIEYVHERIVKELEARAAWFRKQCGNLQDEVRSEATAVLSWPSLSDAIKEVEKMRDGWLKASEEAISADNSYSFLQRAEAAKLIINTLALRLLKSLGTQRED